MENEEEGLIKMHVAIDYDTIFVSLTISDEHTADSEEL